MMTECLYAQSGDTAFVIEETSDGIYLYTYRPKELTGDSWHTTVGEAKAQAAYNVNCIVGPWKSVSPAFKDELAARVAEKND